MSLWGVITWVVVGGLAGWVASIITKTNAQQGLVGNIVAGVIGGVVGGFLLGIIGGSGFTGFNLWSFLVALLGAVIVLSVWKAISKKNA